ncbi:MAG: DsrE family protein [Chloroflexota bacterium]|nr:DsrE family protein [Chloroflexota bacterium]
MKYLLIINTTETETVWNAFRLGAAALSRGHEVSAFLLGPAVEIESIGSDQFDVQKLLYRFDDLGGAVLSCTTCLRLRKMDAGALCPMSTMDDLVRLTEESDRVLTFG